MRLQRQLTDLRAQTEEPLLSLMSLGDAESPSESDKVGAAPRILLPASTSVLVVDSAASLQRCKAVLQALHVSGTGMPRGVVAIDCEWREPRPISLVQVQLQLPHAVPPL